ncbi:hypothetical protein ABMA10_21240 [Plantibacter sp. RU18]
MDGASAPDFLSFDDAQTSMRLLDRADVIFECTHRSATHDGGITVGRDTVVLGGTDDVVLIESDNVVGWWMGDRADVTMLTIWSRLPEATHETSVLGPFVGMASVALAEIFGDAQRPLASVVDRLPVPSV